MFTYFHYCDYDEIQVTSIHQCLHLPSIQSPASPNFFASPGCCCAQRISRRSASLEGSAQRPTAPSAFARPSMGSGKAMSADRKSSDFCDVQDMGGRKRQKEEEKNGLTCQIYFTWSFYSVLFQDTTVPFRPSGSLGLELSSVAKQVVECGGMWCH